MRGPDARTCKYRRDPSRTCAVCGDRSIKCKMHESTRRIDSPTAGKYVRLYVQLTSRTRQKVKSVSTNVSFRCVINVHSFLLSKIASLARNSYRCMLFEFVDMATIDLLIIINFHVDNNNIILYCIIIIISPSSCLSYLLLLRI